MNRFEKYKDSVIAKLKAEGVDLQNSEECTKVLQECVASEFCIKVYYELILEE